MMDKSSVDVAIRLLALVVCSTGGLAIADEMDMRPVGPMIGRLTPYTAQVWARLPPEDGNGRSRLLVEDTADGTLSRWNAVASKPNDWCVTWKVTGLKPATEYSYRVRQGGNLVFGGKALKFRTPDADGEDAVVRLGFGSCAEDDAASSRVFDQVIATECDAMVLLGDTPYIDSTELAVQRRKHRAFLWLDGLRKLARNRPVYATWDDHDFGGSNSDGSLNGKELARQAFSEYRAHPPFGLEDEGIFSRFRHGPVEVFLLDARYFAGAGDGPVEGAPTLLGKQQWKWLTEGLRASTAPVKVLASGAVWHDLPPEKPDCWARYAAERDALFRFIGEQSVSGVVLVSGDLHQSRIVEHKTIAPAGYSIVEFVASPIHAHTEPDANTPHPGLLKHLDAPNVFLQLEIDTLTDSGTVTGRYVNKDGEVLHEEILALALLQKGD